jgi:hypothetical protein
VGNGAALRLDDGWRHGVEAAGGLVRAEDPAVGQGLLQQAEDVPVEIVDGGGEEDQGADRPALPPDLGVELVQLVHLLLAFIKHWLSD